MSIHKTIQIILGILILIGVVLLFTQSYWVSPLVDQILKWESGSENSRAGEFETRSQIEVRDDTMPEGVNAVRNVPTESEKIINVSERSVDGIKTYPLSEFRGPFEEGVDYAFWDVASPVDLKGIVDLPTFESLKDLSGKATRFSKDKNYVYGRALQEPTIFVVDNIDPKTFVALLMDLLRDDRYPEDELSGWIPVEFYKDANHVYSAEYAGLRILEGADPKTFEIIKSPNGKYSAYAKDKTTIYSLAPLYQNPELEYSFKLKGADHASFQVLDSNHAKDINTHYYFNMRIERSDL